MDPYRATLILVTGINLFAATRLIAAGVARTQPWLLGFLLYQLAQNLLGLSMSVTSRLYQTLYTFSEPLNWVLYLVVIWEMYRLAFSGYPGIASIARWACYASAGIATVIGIIIAAAAPQTALSAKFSYVASWEKCTCFALAAFILLMVFLLSRYPIKMGWNEAISIFTFTVYFFGNFAALEINLDGSLRMMMIRNYAVLALCGMCYLTWGVLLRSASGISKVRVRANLNALEERRLMDELESLNSLLVKVARQ